MQDIKVWPDSIESGDHRIGGVDHVALRFEDTEQALRVSIMFRREHAIQGLRDLHTLIGVMLRDEMLGD